MSVNDYNNCSDYLLTYYIYLSHLYFLQCCLYEYKEFIMVLIKFDPLKEIERCFTLPDHTNVYSIDAKSENGDI